MNVRDRIAAAMVAAYNETHAVCSRTLAAPGEFDVEAAAALDALCPPGSRVVVDRAGTPCDECNGKGEIYEMGRWSHCNGPCGGSGVVEATTTTAVEPGRGEIVWQSIGGAQVPRWVETWRAVALPEDGEV